MGVSTDAILFYGYTWDEPDEDEAETEWEERVARTRGLHNPWDDFPQEWQYGHEAEARQWKADNQESIDGWYDALRSIKAETGCDIGWHGSDEWRIPYVYVKDAEYMAARGYPEVIESLAIGDDWNDKLAQFVKLISADISGAQGPAWLLVSWWG